MMMNSLLKYLTIPLLVCVSAMQDAHAVVTIEECVEKAEANYPLIHKYELLTRLRDIELGDVDKSWLPRIGVYAQATAQNAVPSFPEGLRAMMAQMGRELQGLDKLQYKAGADIAQTIWDGGMAKQRRAFTRAQDATRRAATEVEMYAVRQRVENLFFSILLVEEQIAQNRVSYDLLQSNLDKLRSMLRNGTAMQSDVDMVEAQALSVRQGISQACNTASGLRQMLALFVGENLEGESLIRPEGPALVANESNRPELRLFERQIDAIHAAEKMSNISHIPTIGMFAQAYYGYPGFDYFQSMTKRNPTFNILGGVKLQWNIDAFYTKKSTASKAAAEVADIENDREVFLFNSDVQTASQQEAIKGLRDVIADDNRIIALRANVRKAAESQLENGVIDATALLSKIADENMARLNAGYHEIQLIQEIYNLKYTLNQ